MVPWAMRRHGWESDCHLNEAMTGNEIFQAGKITFNDGAYNLQPSVTRESRTEQSADSHIQVTKGKSQVCKKGKSEHKMLSSISSFPRNIKDPSQKLIHRQCVE